VTALYDRIEDLPLTVEGLRLEPREFGRVEGWTRRTTTVVLRGDGLEGVGEDVTWQDADQLAFQEEGGDLPVAGRFRLGEFFRRLDDVQLFTRAPEEPHSLLYRRWAFESAALDLALMQAGRSLAELLERDVRPLTFVASLGLGDPASLAPLHRLLERNPEVEFKVDYAENWTPELIRDLAGLGRVRAVDLKGQYRGAFRGPASDPVRYRMIAEAMPEIWIEDPEWTPETEDALRPHLARVTWDAPIHSVSDVDRLPHPPRCLNVKPSRFGTLRELFDVYDACRRRGIRMYGGGQFELGPGRGQAQLLASLFHPDEPNDLAPAVYNVGDAAAALPRSPLRLKPRHGFGVE
jgi:hypothetical protein